MKIHPQKSRKSQKYWNPEKAGGVPTCVENGVSSTDGVWHFSLLTDRDQFSRLFFLGLC